MENSVSLQRILSSGDPRMIHLNLLENISNYNDFIEALHYALENLVIVKLEEKKNILEKHKDEVLISAMITENLNNLFYEAVNEARNNGAVDITVSKGIHKWLGEAKIYYDNPSLIEGFRQLSSRYSNASNINANQGGFLIYNFRPNTKNLIDIYKKIATPILSEEFSNFNYYDCDVHPLRFYSSHIEESSGLTYTVKHFPISLNFNPIDKSGLNRKDKESSHQEEETNI